MGLLFLSFFGCSFWGGEYIVFPFGFLNIIQLLLWRPVMFLCNCKFTSSWLQIQNGILGGIALESHAVFSLFCDINIFQKSKWVKALFALDLCGVKYIFTQRTKILLREHHKEGLHLAAWKASFQGSYRVCHFKMLLLFLRKLSDLKREIILKVIT